MELLLLNARVFERDSGEPGTVRGVALVLEEGAETAQVALVVDLDRRNLDGTVLRRTRWIADFDLLSSLTTEEMLQGGQR